MLRRFSHFISAIFVVSFILISVGAWGQRKITPVNNAATATQPINENANDTARIKAKMMESMAHYHDENGNIVYIDTITGKEWRDTAQVNRRIPMKYPLFDGVTVGIDVWNPIMRTFGQKYGLIDFMAQLSLHNRYKPTFETGIGIANNTPADNNFTYKSPLSVYFKLGLDYNFLYNSTPDYQFLAGIRFGFSPFAYHIEDITINSSYWDDSAHPTIPSQHVSVVWWEIAIGLRVKIWGPLSAGWTFRYHSIAHETKSEYGQPWYIPGYGTRGMALTGSFTFSYTLQLNKNKASKVNLSEGVDTMYFPETSGQPTLEQINEGNDAQTPQS